MQSNCETDKYAIKLLFDRIGEQHGIDHCLTKPRYPWTNGQVKRMNRTVKEAFVHRFLF